MLSDIIFHGHVVDFTPWCWKVGDRFVATMLSSSEFDGQSGVIIGEQDASTCCFPVKLDGYPECLQIQPQNMIPFFLPKLTEDQISSWYARYGEKVAISLEDACNDIVKYPLSFQQANMYNSAQQVRDSYKQWPDAKRVPVMSSLNRDDLVVQQSSIPGSGRGVFAGPTKLLKGTILTQYAGWYEDETHDDDEDDDVLQNFSAYYCLGIYGDPTVADSRLGVAQMINDVGCIAAHDIKSRNKALLNIAYHQYIASSAQCNVVIKQKEGFVVAIAKKDIEPGAELFFHYGSDYWLKPLAWDVAATHDICLVRLIEEFYEEAEEWPWKLRFELDKNSNPNLVHDESGKVATDQDCYWVIRYKYGQLAKWECEEMINHKFAGGMLKGSAYDSVYEWLLMEVILATACLYLIVWVVASHCISSRSNESRSSVEEWLNYSWKLPRSLPLLQRMWTLLVAYKAKQVPGKAHSQGPARVCIIRGAVEWVEQNKADSMEWQDFINFHQQLAYSSTSVHVLYQKSLEFGTLKVLKEENKFLLIIRPYQSAAKAYEPLLQFLGSVGERWKVRPPLRGLSDRFANAIRVRAKMQKAGKCKKGRD